jgi:hypothetical protein
LETGLIIDILTHLYVEYAAFIAQLLWYRITLVVSTGLKRVVEKKLMKPKIVGNEPRS